MHWKFINSQEDMARLREVHKVDLFKTAGSAVIYGNEDSPDLIVLYEEHDPKFTDKGYSLRRMESGIYQALLMGLNTKQ